MQTEPKATTLLRLVEAGLGLAAPPLAPPPYAWDAASQQPRYVPHASHAIGVVSSNQ